MAQPSPAAMSSLQGLVLSLFTADEFRRWLRYDLVAGIDAELPGANAPYAELTDRALDLLNRRGWLGVQFFATLRSTHPRRIADIERVAALWQPASSTNPTGRSAVALVATALQPAIYVALRRLGFSTPLVDAMMEGLMHEASRVVANGTHRHVRPQHIEELMASLGCPPEKLRDVAEVYTAAIHCVHPPSFATHVFYLSKKKVTQTFRAHLDLLRTVVSQDIDGSESALEKLTYYHCLLLRMGQLRFLTWPLDGSVLSTDPSVLHYIAAPFRLIKNFAFNAAFPDVQTHFSEDTTDFNTGLAREVFRHADESLCPYLTLVATSGEYRLEMVISRRFLIVGSRSVINLAQLLAGSACVLGVIAELERRTCGPRIAHPLAFCPLDVSSHLFRSSES